MKTGLSLIFLVIVSSSFKILNNTPVASKVYFKIDTEKTHVDDIGAIMLSFDIVNNSNEDIVILKPRETFDPSYNFFSNTLECGDIPLWQEDASEVKWSPITENDYLTVKAKTRMKLLMNGRMYPRLACKSEMVEIKIKYEPFETIKPGEREKEEIMKRVSNIKIYSNTVKLKLRKQ